MSKINKTNSGLLFFEDFSEQTLMWTLSPSNADCLSFGDNGLQMKHNEHYVTYTIAEPSVDEYSCIVNLDHIPRTAEDIAGILVMSSTKEYAECQSYMATEPSELNNDSGKINTNIENFIIQTLEERFVTWSENDVIIDDTTSDDQDGSVIFVDTLYRYIKFTKVKYKYIFWASEDSITWIEIGNVKFEDSGVIGFFVYGTKDLEILNNSHCYFKTFALYKSNYITINGVDRGHEMEIYDEDGNILVRTDNIRHAYMIGRFDKRCTINTVTLPIPIRNAKLRIYPKKNYTTTVGEFDLGTEVYGGDDFTLERDIRLFINNQEINPLELYNLGVFYRGSYFIKMDVHNNEDYVLNDIKVKVIQYSEYYGGEHEIAVALYDEDKIESELVYDKEVIIDSLLPKEGRTVFMKLTDKPIHDFYLTANDYRFKIIIE